jgi:KTSC domain
MPSSVIASMQYDPAKQTLRVRFVSGLEYDYCEVPANIFRELKQSKMKGVYLNQKIKGHFPYKKVSNT